MSDPRIIPPPPNYPPTNHAHQPPPEPTIIVVTPEHVTEHKTRLRPIYNLTALGAALAPALNGHSTATAVGTLLHNIRTDHPAGAWTISAALIGTAAYIDHTRRHWPARALLATTALGALLALPVLDAALYLMTGATR